MWRRPCGDRLAATSSRLVAEEHQPLVFELPLGDGQRAAAKVIDAALVAADTTGRPEWHRVLRSFVSDTAVG